MKRQTVILWSILGIGAASIVLGVVLLLSNLLGQRSVNILRTPVVRIEANARTFIAQVHFQLLRLENEIPASEMSMDDLLQKRATHSITLGISPRRDNIFVRGDVLSFPFPLPSGETGLQNVHDFVDVKQHTKHKHADDLGIEHSLAPRNLYLVIKSIELPTWVAVSGSNLDIVNFELSFSTDTHGRDIPVALQNRVTMRSESWTITHFLV